MIETIVKHYSSAFLFLTKVSGGVPDVAMSNIASDDNSAGLQLLFP